MLYKQYYSKAVVGFGSVVLPLPDLHLSKLKATG